MVALAACQTLWVLWKLCTTTGPRPALEDAAATGPEDLPPPLHCSEQFLVAVKKWVGENTRERIMLSDSSLRVYIVSENRNLFIYLSFFFFSPLSDWKNKWYFKCDRRCLESLAQKDFKVFIQYF